MNNHDNTFIMSPKVDFCFKELLADEEVRQGFIAAVLGVRAETIERTELLPTYLRKQYQDDKLGILDVRVMFEDNSQMDIEMQVIAYDYWAERSLFYLCKMFTEQIHEGEDYDELKKCIHVGILNFTLFDDEEYYSKFHIWEDERKLLYTDKIEVHVLELPKLKRYEYPETELLRWARFFNAENKEEMKMAVQGDKYMEKAYSQLVNLSADEEKRLEYEQRQKAIRDHRHMINSGWRQGHREGYGVGYAEGCEEGRQEGLQEGRQEGLQEGRQEGLQEGLEEGRQEGKEAGMKAMVETLQEIGLTRMEIKEKLSQKFSISEEEAERHIEIYWKA